MLDQTSNSILRLTFTVELEVKYNSFDGRTIDEFAEAVHDDVCDALFEVREDDVLGVFTDLVEIETIQDEN